MFFRKPRKSAALTGNRPSSSPALQKRSVRLYHYAPDSKEDDPVPEGSAGSKEGEGRRKGPSLAQRIWEANKFLDREWEELENFDENAVPLSDDTDTTDSSIFPYNNSGSNADPFGYQGAYGVASKLM